MARCAAALLTNLLASTCNMVLTGAAVVPPRVLARTCCLLCSSANVSSASVNELQRRVGACSTLHAVSLAPKDHNV